MTFPPMDSPGPELWMVVSDVFRITGRGTVITGQVQGTGQVSVGDTAVCDGVSWQVAGIEQFRAMVRTALPGTNVGVMLKGGPPADMLRGQQIQFLPAGAQPEASPQFTVIEPKKKRWRR
jgi:translation elongation factor EF-Tu-like GTPase